MKQQLVRIPILAILSFMISGCVNSQVITHNAKPAVTNPDIAEHTLLDVGVVLFDPGLPEDEQKLEKSGLYPEVRKAEARFIAYHMKSTLEQTGNWGAVRAIPSDHQGTDVIVNGTILNSDGDTLTVEVEVSDTTGRKWFKKEYSDKASKFAYKEYSNGGVDPFQDIYNEVANDMLAYRDQLDERTLVQLRQVTQLKFAAELSPTAFSRFLDRDKRGLYKIESLPAADDPMVVRMATIRDREYAFVDTLDEYYGQFYRDMTLPYNNWRQYTYEEVATARQIKANARNRMLAGAAMVVGGIMVDRNGSNTATRVVGTGAAIAGVTTFKSGLDRRREAKIHDDTLKELSDSLESEVAPLVVEVEGRTMELKGSAEAQYAEWRKLLEEIYAAETGFDGAQTSE